MNNVVGQDVNYSSANTIMDLSDAWFLGGINQQKKTMSSRVILMTPDSRENIKTSDKTYTMSGAKEKS